MEYTASLILPVIVTLLTRAGASILRALHVGLDELSLIEEKVFALGAGLTALSLCVLGLGMAGWLTRTSAWVLIIAIACIPSRRRGRELYFFSKTERILLALAAAALVLSWLQGLLPATGNDALAYHLAFPKEFIQNGRIGYLPFTRESLWPFQTEMLFTLGLLLQGTALAQLFHWIFYPLTALLIYAYGRRFHTAQAGSVGAAAFLFIPAAFAQSGQAYVDLSLTFFIFAAFYAFALRGTLGDGKAVALCGALCGAALGTKFLALGAFAVLLALWVLRRRKLDRAVLLFIVSAVGVSGVWYLRSYLQLGNPVYPFFHELFGGHGFASAAGTHVGLGRGLKALAAFPWNITMRPEAFGGEILGPVFLAFLPLLLIRCRRPSPAATESILFTAGYGLFLFSQSQHARFMLSLAPLLCVGVGISFQRLAARGRLEAKAAVTVLMLILLVHSGIFIHRIRKAVPVLTGRMSAQNYLMEHERSFRGYDYLKKNAGPGQRIFNCAEVRRFYNASPGMVYDTDALRQSIAASGLSMAEYLDRERFDHLWLRRDDEVPPGYDPVFAYSFDEPPAHFETVIYRRKAAG